MFLEIKDLSKRYQTGLWKNQYVPAVDQCEISIEKGEIFGIIGESGCGKSTLTKMILGILKPSAGQIIYNEKMDLSALSKKQWKPIRKEIQCIFQHPQTIFHPQKRLYDSCIEPLRIHHICSKEEEKKIICNAMQEVGIEEAQLKKYPHEISGGQAQRIAIARALMLNPKLLLCDEPTSMLDVSIQAQILKLLKEINEEKQVTMLFISHDLDVIEYMCDKVAVMKDGRILEKGETKRIFTEPSNEYTRKLLQARL